MEQSFPYHIVARSGLLCLGHPQFQEHGISSPAHAFWNSSQHTAPMMLGVQFDCPKIHFVLSILDKVDDPSTVIISYGVSDCLSRMVEMSKHDIASILFP